MEETHGHKLEILAHGGACAVYRCDCGIYHLRLKNVAVKLTETEFRAARDSMLLAGTAILTPEYTN
ncbi:MAG: hypothetical protein JNM27_16345 [Leptospirales bacterium]|nr:hypothetical protein [Leptospirales bacterium]